MSRNKYGQQIHIRMTGQAYRLLRPTAATIRQMEQVWLQTGRTPPGVTIRGTVWGERLSQKDARKRLLESGAEIGGCPGLVRYEAQPNVTMADYDTPEGLPPLTEVWAVAGQLGLRPVAIEDHKTARGWHRTVFWDRKFSPAETVCLQLLMGSDRSREVCNLRRILSGDADGNPRWNLLFERKY